MVCKLDNAVGDTQTFLLSARWPAIELVASIIKRQFVLLKQHTKQPKSSLKATNRKQWQALRKNEDCERVGKRMSRTVLVCGAYLIETASQSVYTHSHVRVARRATPLLNSTQLGCYKG